MYASCKKQNMVCLGSNESELMALVGGACEGIATKDQWSKMCNCSPGTIVLCTDSPAALGFAKRKGASRRTRHVEHEGLLYAGMGDGTWTRILKVHGDSQQVADCLTKIMTPRAAPPPPRNSNLISLWHCLIQNGNTADTTKKEEENATPPTIKKKLTKQQRLKTVS